MTELKPEEYLKINKLYRNDSPTTKGLKTLWNEQVIQLRRLLFEMNEVNKEIKKYEKEN